MVRFIYLIWVFPVMLFAQTAADYNQLSKDFLSKGDPRNALAPMRKAAEAGNAEAQYNLGYCYQAGIEVPQSDSIANTWYQLSAAQGWKDAQFKIAYSYSNGRGYKKNDSLAFHWTLECARQNDPDCMFNLVGLYQTGTGVGRNLDSMIAWASRLGALENPADLNLSGRITSARLNLGMMYSNNNVVPRDLVRAYAWFLLYNENKIDFSVEEQKKQVLTIVEVEHYLTAAQKIKAKDLAETIIGHKLKNLKSLYEFDE